MSKLAKIFLTIGTVVLATVCTETSVEAKEKLYKVPKNDVAYYFTDGFSSAKKGEAILANGGIAKLESGSNETVYYAYKSGTTDVSKVKALTMSSKKIKRYKYKNIKIKKDTVIKFKTVKGKVTKAKFKKAKTYYFVCKVKTTDFAEKQTAPEVFNKVKRVGIKIDTKACDKVVYSINNGAKKEEDSDSFYFTVSGPTTVTVTGYKFGKNLGTYTYKYDIKKYKPKKLHDYKLKGSLPNVEWCKVLSIPYGDGYAVSYTLDGSTPTLENGTFMSEFEEDTRNLGYREETGCYVERFTRYGKVTVNLQLYKKVYFKNEDNEYEFSHYEEFGDVQSRTYKTWGYHTNDDSNMPYSDPKWRNSIMYMSAIAPTTTEIPHLTKMRVTYIDMWGYMVTKELKPGEKLTDVHTRAQRLGWVVSFYVDGENVDEEHYDQKVKAFIDGVNRCPNYCYRTVTYQDYLDSFTDHPARVCTGEDLSTPDND